jgi:hypothetical protein
MIHKLAYSKIKVAPVQLLFSSFMMFVILLMLGTLEQYSVVIRVQKFFLLVMIINQEKNRKQKELKLVVVRFITEPPKIKSSVLMRLKWTSISN